MKKLIKSIVGFFKKKNENQVSVKIYMPGEVLPYREDEIEDVTFEII